MLVAIAAVIVMGIIMTTLICYVKGCGWDCVTYLIIGKTFNVLVILTVSSKRMFFDFHQQFLSIN